MEIDEEVVKAIMTATISRSGGRIRRISLCQRGRRPKIISDSCVMDDAAGAVLWDDVLLFLASEETTVLLPRGRGVALSVVVPDVVLVAEFDRLHQLGVAGALLQEAASEIRSKGLRQG